MREMGLRNVDLDCGCGRSVTVNVDHLPDEVSVPEIRLLYRCSVCEERPYRSMPDWRGFKAPGRAGYTV
jgi:hypothetical protein